MDYLCVGSSFHTFDTATTGVDVTDNVAHVIFGYCYCYFHDGFQQNSVTFSHSFFESHGTSDLVSGFGGVNVMVGTIVNFSLNAQYGIAAQDTALHCLLNTFIDSGDVFFRNRTTNCRIYEFVVVFSICADRVETYFTVTILTTTTRLTNEFTFNVNFFAECFFVSYLRSTNVSFYFEFSQQTVNDDFQMQFTHTGDDCVTCFLICVCFECGIFFSQFSQSDTHFVTTSFCFRFDRYGDNGFGEYHGFQDYFVIFVADCVTCCRDFETYSCSDVAGVYFVDFFSVVCVHLQDTANTFFFATFCGVVNICAGIQCTRVHTEECQFTYEGVIHYFEYQSRERFFVRCVSNYFFTCCRVCTFDRFDICRCGHIFDNAVQQFLNAFVSVCGTTHYGHQFTSDTSFTQCSFQFSFCDFFFCEEFFHQFFICFCNCFYHDRSVFFSLIHVFCRDFFFVYFCTCCVFIEVSFHFHQVDDTSEIAFSTDRQSNCYGVAAQSVYDRFHGTEEVSTHDVHFVNEDHTGYFIVVSLSPNCFCLRFNTALCVQYANSAVQYTQGTFYFNCEVNVTGCIDDVDSVI